MSIKEKIYTYMQDLINSGNHDVFFTGAEPSMTAMSELAAIDWQDELVDLTEEDRDELLDQTAFEALEWWEGNE